jgi:2-amino-4-hydroxy-6-hydroxymethyldihydropteridine diphosphokinase
VIEAYVALGSNLGDRAAHLAFAVAALRETPGIQVDRVSSIRETEPVGGPPQGPYLNGVVALRTRLAPRALLERLLAIEAATGRERGPEQNAPRTLDLDLLLYGDEQIDEPDLVVPHPRMRQRPFVMEPLAELGIDLQ